MFPNLKREMDFQFDVLLCDASNKGIAQLCSHSIILLIGILHITYFTLSPSHACLHIGQTTVSTGFYWQCLFRWCPSFYSVLSEILERFFTMLFLVFICLVFHSLFPVKMLFLQNTGLVGEECDWPFLTFF